jgi:hypothetical protein
MGADELQELHEHAEEARHDPSAAPVSLTMAVLAVVVATVSLLGHRAHTEEVVLQNRSSDQWAYYQAKNIRRHEDQIFVDLSSLLTAKDAGTKDAGDAASLRQKYSEEAKRYADEQKDLEAEANRLQAETRLAGRKADRYHATFQEEWLLVCRHSSWHHRNRSRRHRLAAALKWRVIVI